MTMNIVATKSEKRLYFSLDKHENWSTLPFIMTVKVE